MKIDSQLSSKIYDLLNYAGKNNFMINDLNKEPYAHLGKIDKRNIELIATPEIVEREKRGLCYDQTFLVKKWMDEVGIQNKIFYSVTDNLKSENDLYYYSPGIISHAFILCLINEKWKWIEWSWSANIHNRLENTNIDKVLEQYIQMAERSWHKHIKLIDISNIEFNLPMSRLDYLNKCLRS